MTTIENVRSVDVTPELVRRFAALFAGHEGWRGVYNGIPDSFDSDGKRVGNERRTAHGGAGLDHFRDHLEGRSGLGVVPIRADSTVQFGAIDIDVYGDLSHQEIAKHLGDLPLIVVRSKSGGAHIYAFTSEPVPAALMVARLKEIAVMLGHATCEVFPKQTAPTEKGGSWINLPYFAGVMGMRYAIAADGNMLDLEQFVDAAGGARQPRAWFEAAGVVPAIKEAAGSESAVPAIPQGVARVSLEKIQKRVLAAIGGPKCRGRNDAGFYFISQSRMQGWTRAEIAEHLAKFVDAANEKHPVHPLYQLDEALDSLSSHFGREPDWKQQWKFDEESTGAKQSDTGLVQELEKAIKEKYHFARDEGDRIYVFESGVYKPKGERVAKLAVRNYLENAGKAKSWTPELASRVIEYLSLNVPPLWDRPPLDRVNVRNGLLDVAARTLSEHSPDFLSPVQLDVDFDPAATCPAIGKFVSEVFPADAQGILYEIAAWLMLPDTSIQKAVLAVGEGANGKSVFLGLLEDFIGRENVSSVALHKIESDKFAAARLVGKLANICADLPTAALSGTSTFKALSGGDLINAERKYYESFEFRPYARLVFSANTLPRSDDPTHGFFRRWLVIPFESTFRDSDPGYVPMPILKARLRAELPGLLNRALDALPHVQRGAFTESASMRKASEEFRRTTDPLAVWLESHTVDGSGAYVPKWQIRKLYEDDCKENGRPILPESVFTERLRRLKPHVTTGQRTPKRVWCFLGIGLRAEGYEECDESRGKQQELYPRAA